MIHPTNGRVVWYTPSSHGEIDSAMEWHDKSKPLAAMVVHVWSSRMVNLVVFDSNGTSFGRTSVDLVQEGDTKPASGRFCEWMPYQIGQAKAHAV